MTAKVTSFLPCLLAGIALAILARVLSGEVATFKAAVIGWAEGDLHARTELAAETLSEALETSNFKRLRDFGDECTTEGMRLTVSTVGGGKVFESQPGSNENDWLYCSKTSGDYVIRLALPKERVLAPFTKAKLGLILAGLLGGTSILLVLLFMERTLRKMKSLATERDAQAKLLEEMKKVEKFRSQFIADVSHEIKTPLTGILGVTDLLGNATDDETRAILVPMLRKSAERINFLVRDILALSRLEGKGDDMRQSFRKIDISEIIDETINETMPQAESSGISIMTNIERKIVRKADGEMIRRAVTNLIRNAIIHSGTRDISVSLRKYGSSIRIIVEDHGKGIPVEYRERVFERFFRLDESRDEKTGGTGLGLAIVKRIAEAHNGEVRLEEPAGGGSRFIIDLPSGTDDAT